MRACKTTDDLLFAFVDGLNDGLDEHVANCDECQAFLAELWQGELAEDLAEPVMARIRLADFVSDVAKLGFDIAAAMGRGILTYGPGAPLTSEDDRDDPAQPAIDEME